MASFARTLSAIVLSAACIYPLAAQQPAPATAAQQRLNPAQVLEKYDRAVELLEKAVQRQWTAEHLAKVYREEHIAVWCGGSAWPHYSQPRPPWDEHLPPLSPEFEMRQTLERCRQQRDLIAGYISTQDTAKTTK